MLSYEGEEGSTGWDNRYNKFREQELILGDKDIARKLANKSIVRVLQPAEPLYTTKDDANLIFFVFSGSIELVDEDGVIAVLEEKEYLGEFPFLRVSPTYTVSAIAKKQSVVAQVNYSDFREIIANTEIWERMSITLGDRLKKVRRNQGAARMQKIINEQPASANVAQLIGYGQMRSELRDAILAGFSPIALDEVLRHNDMFRHNIALGPDFATRVNSLIDVSCQEGWLVELCGILAAARAGNQPVSSSILAVQKWLTECAGASAPRFGERR